MDRYSDFLLFEASSPLLFRNGQILGLLIFEASSPLFFRNGQILELTHIRGLVFIIMKEWTVTRTFSYSKPRLHYFSGMDRYSDFLLFEASSPFLFRNGQILGLSPVRGFVSITFSGMERYSNFLLFDLVNIIFQEWTDTLTFSRPRLHYLSRNGPSLGLSLIRGLVSIIVQEWTDIRTIFYSRPRLHNYSGIDIHSDILLFKAFCIFIQEWMDTPIFSFSMPRLHYFSGMDRLLFYSRPRLHY